MRRTTARRSIRCGLAVALLASCTHRSPAHLASEPAVGAANPAPLPAELSTHRVEPGETVWAISVRYGTSTTKLIAHNGIRDVRRLRVGRLLEIPNPDSAQIDEVLASGEQHLRAAEFDEAFEMAMRALRFLASAPDTAGVGTQIARAETIAATVHIAHARKGAAIRSLQRALRADEHLELDPAATSRLTALADPLSIEGIP